MNARQSLVYDRRKTGNGEIDIKIYFPETKKTMYLSTGEWVEPRYWDTTLKEIKPKAKETRKAVARKMFAVEEALVKAASIAEFKARISDKWEFLAFMENEINNSNLSPNTLKSYLRTLDLAKEFGISNINYETAVKFDRFLNKKFNNKNTVKKHHRILKQYILHAHRMGFIPTEQYDSYLQFKTRGQEVNKDYLDSEEIRAIKELELTGKWETVRDMFLFSYYTALRLSDVQELRPEHFKRIEGDLRLIKGVYKLRHINRKVNINLSFNFNGEGERLILKYMDNDPVFEYMSVPGINYAVKGICKKAGITKSVSFHTARHSSLTFVAALSGDVFAVMNHGSITNISTAQKYIHITQEMMKKIKW